MCNQLLSARSRFLNAQLVCPSLYMSIRPITGFVPATPPILELWSENPVHLSAGALSPAPHSDSVKLGPYPIDAVRTSD